MDKDVPKDRTMDNDIRITPAMEDYLKAIYRLAQDDRAVTTQRLADELQISGASVTNMVKRLNDLNLLIHLPYRGVSLTETGTIVALEVIRHHRLLELYLSQALGFDIDQVHAEADRLEHHVSEELESRMEQALGFPQFDPHGHPIPSRSGTLPEMLDILLTDLPNGQSAVVSRVSDRDQELLRQIDALGIGPGIQLQAVAHNADGVTVMLGDQERVVSPDLADLINVRPQPAITPDTIGRP